jgi:hypothetical protein
MLKFIDELADVSDADIEVIEKMLLRTKIENHMVWIHGVTKKSPLALSPKDEMVCTNQKP